MEGMSCCLFGAVFALFDEAEADLWSDFGVDAGTLFMSESERSESLLMPLRSASFLSLEEATSLRERLSFLPEGMVESRMRGIDFDLTKKFLKFLVERERLNTMRVGAEVRPGSEGKRRG